MKKKLDSTLIEMKVERLKDVSQENQSLFPIKIPREFKAIRLHMANCPMKLLNSLKGYGIKSFGQLEGMKPYDFFAMRGFGGSRFHELINLLKSMSEKNDSRSHLTEMQVKSSYHLDQSKLDKATTANLNFLQLMEIIKSELSDREKEVFDNRLFPIGEQFLRLRHLANKYNLTRERIRQIEQSIIDRITIGKWRAIGYIIKNKTLQRCIEMNRRVMSYEEILGGEFFDGCRQPGAPFPAPVRFLTRVFRDTFQKEFDSIYVMVDLPQQQGQDLK